MNRQQILHIVKENESLKMKVQRLQQSTERLQSRYNDAESDINSFKRKYDFLRDQFREIVRNCFPREYIENKMRDFSEIQLYEYIVSRVTELEKDNFYNAQENDKLKQTLKETIDEMERLQNAGPMMGSYNPDDEDYEGNGDGDNNEEGNVVVSPKASGLASMPVDVSSSENPVAGVMSLIEDREWPFIKVIGDGETQFAKISEALGTANATVSTTLSELTDKGLINFEKIAKGGKGRPAHHYFLTSLGTKAYEMKYGNKPETTMLEKLSTHGSPAHGGLMLEVGTFLEESGCEVIYDGPETTYRLKDGRDIIFDIKAYDPESKELLLVETERAKSGHLQEKYDKCYEFTKLGISKTVHIVAPDKQALHSIQQELFRWVRKNADKLIMLQKNNIDKAIVIFKTATLEDFKKGKLQTFYYGMK